VASLDRASAGQQNGSLGGLFNRPGLVGGFAAGFLGAGLLGLFFGHGVFGGLGGVASYSGLLCQLALIAMLARLIWSWWSGRNAPAFAGLSPRQLADPYLRSRNEAFPGDMTAELSVGDEEAMSAETSSALGDSK
jgi:predicted lipid-binding transport protein (Tim44 family)